MVRFGYLEADEILLRVSSGKRGPTNLQTLLEESKYPVRNVKNLRMEELRGKLLSHADYRRSVDDELSRLEPEEIIALTILESRGLPQRTKEEIFGHVSNERDLKPPVAEWLKDNKGVEVYSEVKIGKSVADLVGCKDRVWGKKLIAVEIKTDPEEMKRFLDQVTDYLMAADEVYLAATPYAITRYLYKYGKSWYDPKVLENKLGLVGTGLMVVDMSRGEDQCWTEIEYENDRNEKDKRDEIIRAAKEKKPFRP